MHTERILRDSVPAMRAQKKIEAEFQKRDRELAGIADQLKRMQAELDKDAMTMTESQRRAKEREFGDLNREFQRKQREFREDLNQRRNEELAQVVEQANRRDPRRSRSRRSSTSSSRRCRPTSARASTSPTR